MITLSIHVSNFINDFNPGGGGIRDSCSIAFVTSARPHFLSTIFATMLSLPAGANGASLTQAANAFSIYFFVEITDFRAYGKLKYTTRLDYVDAFKLIYKVVDTNALYQKTLNLLCNLDMAQNKQPRIDLKSSSTSSTLINHIGVSFTI